ncbi:MAG: hypothetical protein WBR26_09660 [Candidatus Acidiferrum sp.]
MSLPQQIPVHYAEDDAGYVSVRPVVNQTFRPNELTDMVVRVVGKDAVRVQQIFRTGGVLYNGYRYWWEPLAADLPEIDQLLLPFPEDDPSRPFDPFCATAVLLESGGGTQRNIVEITAADARQKKLFSKTSAWDVLINFAAANPPHYEKYSHARHADLFRIVIPADQGQTLIAAMLEAAPHNLRHRWSTLRTPAALSFVCPR